MSVKTWVWDSKQQQLVPKSEYRSAERKAPHIMPDIAPYQPMGGPEAEKFLKDPRSARMIEGRKQHREYLKRNGFIEVGSDKEAFTKYRGLTREAYERRERIKDLSRNDWFRKVNPRWGNG